MVEYCAQGALAKSTTTVARNTKNSEFFPPHTDSGEMYIKIIVPQTLRPIMTRSNLIKRNYVLKVSVVISFGKNAVIELPACVY